MMLLNKSFDKLGIYKYSTGTVFVKLDNKKNIEWFLLILHIQDFKLINSVDWRHSGHYFIPWMEVSQSSPGMKLTCSNMVNNLQRKVTKIQWIEEIVVIFSLLDAGVAILSWNEADLFYF